VAEPGKRHTYVGGGSCVRGIFKGEKVGCKWGKEVIMDRNCEKRTYMLFSRSFRSHVCFSLDIDSRGGRF